MTRPPLVIASIASRRAVRSRGIMFSRRRGIRPLLHQTLRNGRFQHVSPQAHAPETRSTLGAIHRDEGLMAALNELSGAVGVAASSLAMLLPEKCRPTLKESAVSLLRSVGGVDLAAARLLNSISATHGSRPAMKSDLAAGRITSPCTRRDGWR